VTSEFVDVGFPFLVNPLFVFFSLKETDAAYPLDGLVRRTANCEIIITISPKNSKNVRLFFNNEAYTFIFNYFEWFF